MKRILAVLLLLLAVMASGCSKKEVPAQEGAAAPDFTLSDLSGKQVQLSSLKGKVVLVNFWATWCPPCREEIPSMVKLNQIMQGKNFQMLAISIDEGGKQAVQEFFRQNGVTLPALLDTDGSVSRRYGTTGVPETFIVDGKGMIRKKVIGGVEWSSPEVVGYLEGLMQQK
ncbi:apocytochrome c disulfide reductase lipoprotein ResA [Citrifermentans bemidjiense Bem]|uniref:Apocytochrome c disulfide reductase lipoprotein ResA n=1 Tax=Citrifermentans bemidjiense (strain ATCC BAA-1014 / DSM 16622 / JCM 12645 / Bem) TaxID=404380 RepID=B5EBB3_CITBB|nr:TlpA disulfide reductase family protein [Citrifermentans bemidjiense]ACH40405.1 apocytochrome c disulfide reductase lipoprotein ResA [Citrifermentans bemidjiense Bem]